MFGHRMLVQFEPMLAIKYWCNGSQCWPFNISAAGASVGCWSDLMLPKVYWKGSPQSKETKRIPGKDAIQMPKAIIYTFHLFLVAQQKCSAACCLWCVKQTRRRNREYRLWWGPSGLTSCTRKFWEPFHCSVSKTSYKVKVGRANHLLYLSCFMYKRGVH